MVIPGHNLGNSQVSVYRTIGHTLVSFTSGCGGAAGFTASVVVVSFNFRHKHNLAMGIALSGE